LTTPLIRAINSISGSLPDTGVTELNLLAMV